MSSVVDSPLSLHFSYAIDRHEDLDLVGGGEARQPLLGTDSITACHALENADRFHGDPVPQRHRSPLVELEQTCHVDRVHKPDHIFVLQYTKFLCCA